MSPASRNYRKILFVTLSNIGDCILTLPVLDELRSRIADPEITVLVGRRPAELFAGNPYIAKVITYDKYASLATKAALVRFLHKERFDIVVDLRNSGFGWLVGAALKTSGIERIPRSLAHMRQRHLHKIARITRFLAPSDSLVRNKTLFVSQQDTLGVVDLLSGHGITPHDTVVAVSAGARSSTKRWPAKRFADLIDQLKSRYRVAVVLIGDAQDVPVSASVMDHVRAPVVNLTGRTTLIETAALLRRARLLITNDSANLHLAGYFDVPVVAIFGPTDDARYGPWSTSSQLVKAALACRPCMKAQCRFKTLDCLMQINVDDVRQAACRLLDAQPDIARKQPS